MMKKTILAVLLLICFAEFTIGRRCFNSQAPRSYTGRCNNRIWPRRGMVGTTYKRGRIGWEYVDPLDPISNTDFVARGIPNIRTVSTAVGDQPVFVDLPNDQGLNALAIFFGQFIAHDLTEADFDLGDEFDETMECDTLLCNGNTLTLPGGVILEQGELDENRTFIPMTNSHFVVRRGVSEPINVCTHFLDLSQVYGSSDEVNEGLREFSGGLLKGDDYAFVNPFLPPHLPPTLVPDWLPILNDTNTPTKLADIKQGAPRTDRFGSGDTRTNENIILLNTHGVWFREHNRKANEVAAANPTWDDEEIFQEARRWTIATYQHIVVDEWLPALLGSQYSKVVPHIEFNDLSAPNPTLNQVFVSAAFRIHTGMINFVNPQNECYDSHVTCPPGTPPQQCLEFFPFAGQVSPFAGPKELLSFYGVDSPLRGVYNQPAQQFDTKVTDALRNIPTSTSTVDVLSINLNRARVHGVPNYNTILKKTLGLKNIYRFADCPRENEWNTDDDPIECFDHITSDAALAQSLKDLYGKVNKIDAWIGLYAEDHVQDSAFGKGAATLIARTFSKLRNGDRFWYENNGMFSSGEVNAIKAITMADVFNGNTGMAISDAFMMPDAATLESQKPASCSA